MARHYAGNHAKWEKVAPAVGRVALPYSLAQLSDWLARGGMAAGAATYLGAYGVRSCATRAGARAPCLWPVWWGLGAHPR